MTMKVELCVSAALVCGFAFAGPKDETAAAFWIRFDALPAQCSPVAGVICSADAEGHVKLTLKARPEEVLGDWEMPVRDAVRKGEWRHVAYNYSLMRRRSSVYLDGHW